MFEYLYLSPSNRLHTGPKISKSLRDPGVPIKRGPVFDSSRLLSSDTFFSHFQSLIRGFAALIRLKAVTMAPALLVTMVMASQIVFLLIGQYTILSKVQPGIGNWIEITGRVISTHL